MVLMPPQINHYRDEGDEPCASQTAYHDEEAEGELDESLMSAEALTRLFDRNAVAHPHDPLFGPPASDHDEL